MKIVNNSIVRGAVVVLTAAAFSVVGTSAAQAAPTTHVASVKVSAVKAGSPVLARGGSSGGGRSGGGSKFGGGSKLGGGSKSKSNSGSGSKSNSNSGSKSNSGSGSGSSYKSGSSFAKNKADTTVPKGFKSVTGKAPTSAVSVPKTARASGSTYKSPSGATYHYNRGYYNTTYSTYHGGYPVYGSALYWTLWNDPFYYPNYARIGNPWYGHPYPAGYVVQDGVLYPTGHSTGFKILMWTLGIIAGVVVIVAILAFVGRRSSRRSDFASRF